MQHVRLFAPPCSNLSSSFLVSQYRHQTVTFLSVGAYARHCDTVSDQRDSGSNECLVGGSNPSGRTIHDSNCLRSRGNAESPPLVVSSAFRQRAITSNDPGPSAIAPHGYREQGEQFRVRAVRIPPAAPNHRVARGVRTASRGPVSVLRAGRRLAGYVSSRAVTERRRAIPDQMSSTAPKGQAPERKP